MRITPWLRGRDVDGLTRLLHCRPDGCQAHPGSVDDLAWRLSTAGSVAAAVARLDHDAVLVAQSVVILGDSADVGRLRDVVRGPGEALEGALVRCADRPVALGSPAAAVTSGRRSSFHPLPGPCGGSRAAGGSAPQPARARPACGPP